MKKARKIPADVDTLVEFSNLEAHDVDYFQGIHPDFVPEDWWKLKIGFLWPLGGPSANIPRWKHQFFIRGEMNRVPIWRYQQEQLRNLWHTKFPLEECFEFMSSDAAPWEVYKGDAQMGEEDFVRVPKQSTWPYMTAVLFLAAEPWRARFCGQCGSRFVANKAGRRFCTDLCFQKSRKGSKLAWWHSDQGKTWQAKYKKGRKKK